MHSFHLNSTAQRKKYMYILTSPLSIFLLPHICFVFLFYPGLYFSHQFAPVAPHQTILTLSKQSFPRLPAPAQWGSWNSCSLTLPLFASLTPLPALPLTALWPELLLDSLEGRGCSKLLGKGFHSPTLLTADLAKGTKNSVKRWRVKEQHLQLALKSVRLLLILFINFLVNSPTSPVSYFFLCTSRYCQLFPFVHFICYLPAKSFPKHVRNLIVVPL